MRIFLALTLLAAAVSTARAEDRCGQTYREYAEKVLQGVQLGWLAPGADGRFQAGPDVAAVIQAGPGPDAGLGAAAAQAAADEVALYADELEIPGGVRVAVAWAPPKPWASASALELLAVTPDDCLRARIELNGYSPASARTPPSPSRFDAVDPGDHPPLALMHENCGRLIDRHMSTRPNVQDAQFEELLKMSGAPSMEAGGGFSGLRLAGRDMSNELFRLFSFDRPPRLIIDGDSAIFEVPLYMSGTSPARLTPARLIVQCKDSGDVDLLYVCGDQIQRFSKIPVEIR